MHEKGDSLWHFVMSFVKYRESHYVAVLNMYEISRWIKFPTLDSTQRSSSWQQ